jgi:nucleotide-binding universal stress UspA family protein
MTRWRKILCAVDLRDGSRSALEDAADLARTLDADLTLVHVLVPALASSEAVLPLEALARESSALGDRIRAWKAAAEGIAGRPVRAVLVRGSPGAEIVRAAEEGEYDLLVVGAEGHSVGRLGFGHVAETVVRDAPYPVLVARGCVLHCRHHTRDRPDALASADPA